MTDIDHDSSTRRDSFVAQAPMALLGLAAMAIIALVNVHARPALADLAPVSTPACGECGTVVAVHQSAHAAPMYYVEVRMADGTRRVVQQLAAGFKIGDVVQVNGNALSLRPQAS